MQSGDIDGAARPEEKRGRAQITLMEERRESRCDRRGCEEDVRRSAVANPGGSA